MALTDDVQQLITRLVSLHGEAGVCPTAADWAAIFRVGGDGAIQILNLLKFRSRVDTPDGSISGADAYRRYSTAVAEAFTRAGGERIFFGRVGYTFAFGPAADWDTAVVTRYPSSRALAGMWLDRSFIAAHEHRVDGVERSQVLVFGSPARP